MGCYFWNVWTASSSVTPLAYAHTFTYIQTYTWTCSVSRWSSHSHQCLTHTMSQPERLSPLTDYQSGNRGEKRRRERERPCGGIWHVRQRRSRVTLKAHWHIRTHTRAYAHICMCTLTHIFNYLHQNKVKSGGQTAGKVYREKERESRQLGSFTSVCPLNRAWKKV